MIEVRADSDGCAFLCAVAASGASNIDDGEIALVNAQAGAQAANGAVLIELTLNSQEQTDG